MKIWVDLVNSPQVLVMTPLIREFERRGHEVVVTTRDFAQTIDLADRSGLKHTPMGSHGGASKVQAIKVNLERVGQLVRLMRPSGVDLAVSHNSYSQGLAARLLGVPFVTLMDYEHHRANHLAFRLARRVLVPQAFPDRALERFGARRKAVKYPGIKENLYLHGFRPDPNFLGSIGLADKHPIVVARPPGTWGDYYKGDGRLFSAFLEAILSSNAFLVFLPRIPEQRSLVSQIPPDRLLLPSVALDGPNLVYHADLVVSGGGTMIREAAVLGTPAYSLFEGEIGAVDQYLQSCGRLRIVHNIAQLSAIRLGRNDPRSAVADDRPDLVPMIATSILATAA